MLNRRFLIALAMGATLAGCATAPTPPSVPATIAARADLSTLNQLLKQAGLTETLQGSGPFTVFAPSDSAFRAVPVKIMEDLAKHPDKLKDVLSYHVLGLRLTAAEARNSSIKTVHGATVAVSKAGEFVTIEDAMVTSADLAATNGVVHVIDKVLLPPARK